MTNYSNKKSNKQLITTVDELFTTVTPGELSVSMEQFMGSAIRDDHNPRLHLSGLWYHYEELQGFLQQMIKLYEQREFTN